MVRVAACYLGADGSRGKRVKVAVRGSHVVGSVNTERISDVGLPVRNWSLAGDKGLHVESEHGEHSQSSVLDLLDLKLGEGIRVIGKSKRIEGLTRVKGVKTLTSWATVDTVGLNKTHQHNLAGNNGDDGLGVNKGRVAKVVKTTLGQHKSTSLEPWDVASSIKSLRSDASNNTQHSPSCVDQLGLTVGSEGLRIGGKTGGIPTVVTRELSGKVRWHGTIGERSQPQCTVRSVEFHSLDGGVDLGLWGLGLCLEGGHVSNELSRSKGSHC